MRHHPAAVAAHFNVPYCGHRPARHAILLKRSFMLQLRSISSTPTWKKGSLKGSSSCWKKASALPRPAASSSLMSGSLTASLSDPWRRPCALAAARFSLIGQAHAHQLAGEKGSPNQWVAAIEARHRFVSRLQPCMNRLHCQCDVCGCKHSGLGSSQAVAGTVNDLRRRSYASQTVSFLRTSRSCFLDSSRCPNSSRPPPNVSSISMSRSLLGCCCPSPSSCRA